MARTGPAARRGLRLGIHIVDPNTIEQWYEHATDPRRAVVRVVRKSDLDLWEEDVAAARTTDRSRWDAMDRAARSSLQRRKLDHPLRDIAHTFEATSFNERSLRHLMLYEIIDEIIDADLTADDEWLIGLWREAAMRHLDRYRWVRSAGEPPLRRGPTRGAVQRQLLDVAREALEPLSKKHTAGETKKLAKQAVSLLAMRITENFPIGVDAPDLNLGAKATERVAPELLERVEAEIGFPSDDTLRWFVRRTLAACGLAERAVNTFFHAEHEKKFRERAKKRERTKGGG